MYKNDLSNIVVRVDGANHDEFNYQPQVLNVNMPVFVKTNVDTDTGEITYNLHIDGRTVEYNNHEIAIDTVRLIADLYNMVLADTLYR